MRLLDLIILASLSVIALSADAQEGRQVYEANCASCHGANFQGTGLGPALSTASYIYGGKRDDIIRVVKNGIASRGMPSFQNTLADAQISALADFVPVRRVEENNTPDNNNTKDSVVNEPAFDTAPEKVSTLDYLVKMEVVAEGLETPWALVFTDADTMLLTERAGRLRLIENGKLIAKSIEGTPEVFVSSHQWNQGGLLDIALDPDYSKNGWVYLCYSHAISDASIAGEPLGMTRVVRGKIESYTWSNQEIIYQASHSDYNKNVWHYGGRMVFDKRGWLYFSVGDRGAREQARDLSKPTGKIHRLHANGVIPDDNPFRGKADAIQTIFSFGHRNPQGLALDPNTGEIWVSEHGPRGGDELNILKPAGNYGWSKVSYGINYDGTLLTPHTKAKGIEQPVLYWRPSIGVSGITFYQGREFPLWNSNLLVTGLATRELRLLTVDKERVLHQETLIKFEGRPYEPVVGPDGAIYIVVASPGQLLRLTALEERKI